jgi:hypothetical protein
MKMFFSIVIFLPLLISCRIQPNSDRRYADGNPDKVYRLRLDPPAGSKYEYEISNESEFKLDVDDKKIDNLTKTYIGLDYSIDKDSVGNFVIQMRYNKIKIYTKSGDLESNLDAANTTSLDPTERMLALVKNAKITAILSPAGETRSMNGLREVINSFMSQYNNVDANTKKAVQEKWDNMVGGSLVAGNMEELFRIFPDSGVHIGDKWKLSSKRKSEFSLIQRNNYNLNAIRDGVAFIESEGEISSDSTTTNMMGYEVASKLKGNQRGEYRMEIKTGMMISASVTAKIEGSIELMAKDIPVTIETSLKVDRR